MSVPVFRPKRCKACREQFTPVKQLQAVCGPICAARLPELARAKAAEKAAAADKRETKAKLEKLKSKSQWLKDAQTAFNAYIRARDAARPCVSCGRHHDGQYHAGHYLSTGAKPELRFDEANVHKQCAPCNTHLHGNLVEYRTNLIRRIGLLEVARLEGHTPPKHYTVDDLKAIRDEYRRRAREIGNAGS